MSTNHEIPLVKLEIVPSQTEVREESIQAPTKFQAPPKFQEPPLNLFLESTSNLQEKGKCSEKKKTKQTTEYRNVRTIPRSDRNKVPVSYEISDTKYMYKIVPNVIPKTDRKAKKSKSSKGPRISTKLFSRLLTISGPVEQPNPSKENRKSRSESKKRDIKILKDAEKKEKKRRKKHGMLARSELVTIPNVEVSFF
ncbi:hypothetical protein K7432_001611 [Basidiobolus ranarum]|uniref:Uncharacterized protein n=1 Tax=Basidiobolus ranarum TaxID=34480 RepID=A0ABR2W9E9_9FUNG